jgi:ubiquinone/menaquinone biosynthesis C-methylase UbiE
LKAEASRTEKLRRRLNPMNSRLKLSDIRRFPRFVGQFRHALFYTLNTGSFWDDYVKEWERAGKGAEFQFLGDEWINRERYVELLREHGTGAKKALEIGCGGGRITAEGVKVFDHVSAADVSGEMLRKAQESVAANNVSFHRLDGFTLHEFGDASIDFVFSHDVFVHFSSLQVYPYLREIDRVLRPGGRALVSFYDLTKSWHMFDEVSLQYWKNRRFPPHMRLHFTTEETLRKLITEAGMEVTLMDSREFLIAGFTKPLA